MRVGLGCGLSKGAIFHELLDDAEIQLGRSAKSSSAEWQEWATPTFAKGAGAARRFLGCKGCKSRSSSLVALKVASSCGKIDIDMRMLSAFDVELACARGALRVRPGALRVIWLGRSGAQPVHPSVAGQARLPTKTQHQGVTPAAALLGAMGVLALAFACPTAEIVACDDGSGRLLQYLQRLGFDRASEEPDAAAAGTGQPVAVSMRATCSALVEGCCPPEWVPELPAAGQYSMFASISR
ncbi:unnamed protein product [Prorocentrum cordatum]|uniref:Uncharacterized protein n=1 Tax=Prorocentrum cordatum TaxID=2364126 RepID=A0ABN9XB10_9DINO|nr:unnamed protein product [Polarella glacialis]